MNRTHLYRRKSSFTGKDIISIYSPDKDLKVYENEIWWSDQWDPLEYGRDVDLTKPIFSQLTALVRDVPVMALFNDQNENSPFVNTTGWAKNCYLCYGADYSEDCHYGEAVYYSRNSLDILHGQNLEQCYECTDCNDCYALLFRQNCNNCSDSAFLFDCLGCKHCFGCAGLRQKEYYYFNEKLPEEEYLEKMKEHFPLTPSVVQDLKKKLTKLSRTKPQKSFIGLNNENVSGDYLFHSKNSYECFDSDEVQDCKYCTNMRKAQDCYDINYWGHPGELCYEGLAVGEGSTRVLLSAFVWGGTGNMLYCNSCISCSDCFGCAGLRHKHYCIFNKQYSKEEYGKLVPEIIEHMQQTGEWGEFIPLTSSVVAYNETLGQQFYPLNREEVEKRGLEWRDITDDIPKVDRTIPAMQLPESISDIPDDILNWAITCDVTERPFKLIPQELEFYRKHGLPVPHIHPDERLARRWSLRNPRKLRQRSCAKCGKGIETTYSPERSEIVYCEECYLASVY